MFADAGNILQNTVDDIFSDPRSSLVCLVPFLAANALIFAVGYLSVLTFPAESDLQFDNVQPAIIAAIVLFAIAMIYLVLVGFLWTAVAWHRMVVLGEKPGRILPVWPKGKLGGYLWRSFLIGLLGLIASFPLVGIGAILAPEIMVTTDGGMTYTFDTAFPEDPATLGLRGLAVQFAISAVLYGVYLRLGISLPAQATGSDLSIGGAWEASQGRFFQLYLPLGVLLSLVETVFTGITGLVSFGGVFDIIGFGIMTLLGIGVLTRLYIARFPEAAPLAETSAIA